MVKGIIGFFLMVAIVLFTIFAGSFTGHDTRLNSLSRIITFIIWILSLLILIWRFKVNPIEEFKTIFQFKTKSKKFERSFLKIMFGTVFPIVFSALVISPIITYSLIKINSSNYHKSHLQKAKVEEVYRTNGKRNTKYFVDILYDGKPITIRISRDMMYDIESNMLIPNLNRGRLGFYFIRD
ncbi:MAG: hypothetical protein P8P74_09725 [Crocinitomicaceae bacterium]|nr:hypothetical protein [Crocinitomicaceae bacterium]